MNIQKHFEIKRFAYLFKNDLLLNYKTYLLGVTGFVIIYYLFMLYSMTIYPSTYDSQDYFYTFIIGLFALGFFVGSSFPALSSKNGTFTYIMIPASTLEKFSLQFIFRIVFGTIIFLVSYWVVAYLARVTALQMESVKRSGVFIDSFNYAMLFDGFTGIKHKVIIYITAFTIGITFFSFRLFFKKLAVLKSTVLIVGLVLLLFFVMSILSNLFFPETTKGLFDISILYMRGNSYLLGFKGGSIILFILSFLLILPLGYYRLKEKQI